MFEELLNQVNELVKATLSEAKAVSATDLKLDRRAAYGDLFVTPEFIAVEIFHDRSMQYYGGFEYVDSEHRMQLGDWVFYSAESNRVRKHLAYVFEELDSDEDY